MKSNPAECLYCQNNETLHNLMIEVAKLSVSRVFIFKEQTYHGRCLVAYKDHVDDLNLLSDDERRVQLPQRRVSSKISTHHKQPPLHEREKLPVPRIAAIRREQAQMRIEFVHRPVALQALATLAHPLPPTQRRQPPIARFRIYAHDKVSFALKPFSYEGKVTK